MRFYILLAVLSCLLALCNSTYVSIFNGTKFKSYEALNTECRKVDPWYLGKNNKVTISGTVTFLFSNDDCTNMVGVGYHTNMVWQAVSRPIRSFYSTNSW
ncbi:hypothetical protein GGI08_004855 [Coemansia sp. S2]|nr:hypothetical protein H4S03_004862 [Coemansia sp. S3946]KAJ2053200.1 hypothetical protein GGI08_004855 [Coemansia sp. S2]KAJ2070419.1 hypothetical protein GGH13_004038 [Coemansia sp. S155-1]KAJ2345993.1 hypothetical protein GGH92_003802 [Coemansia sp. RSA 2673]